MLEHQSKAYAASFTARYNVDKLVYYRLFDSIKEAIEEEKRIKGGSRADKIQLIEDLNPLWKDLWESEVSKW